ncbi:hypothetical protein [Cupriavidus basilensis]|uniref:hypothetical protein n=1 Tax=Cupriavidus basilensis TaxID=68895 RepID=UPI0012E08808|nr:hypothetical protein [Cupriavidus basilensis]
MEWSSTAHGTDFRVGDYIFSGGGFTNLAWSPDSSIRIEGNGKYEGTGETLHCLILRGKAVQPCSQVRPTPPANLHNPPTSPPEAAAPLQGRAAPS